MTGGGGIKASKSRLAELNNISHLLKQINYVIDFKSNSDCILLFSIDEK